MRTSVVLVLFFGLAISSEARPENRFSPRAAKALSAPESAVIYSLEPWAKARSREAELHSFKVLGKATLNGKQTATALKAFNAAVSSGDASFLYNCFDPRQALRIVADNQTYDFLLCYECHRLYVYEGDKLLESVSAGGSPKGLNALLRDLHLPLAKISSPSTP